MSDSAKNRWHEWILENQDRWFLYACQQTRSEADAADVLQEALLEIWQGCGADESAPLPHPGTMFTAIRFRALNLARGNDRRGQRESEYADGVNMEWSSKMEQVPANEDEKKILLAALASLPDELEEILTLHLWGGLTFREISEVCKCSINTVAGRYRQALERLQKKLKGILSL